MGWVTITRTMHLKWCAKFNFDTIVVREHRRCWNDIELIYSLDAVFSTIFDRKRSLSAVIIAIYVSIRMQKNVWIVWIWIQAITISVCRKTNSNQTGNEWQAKVVILKKTNRNYVCTRVNSTPYIKWNIVIYVRKTNRIVGFPLHVSFTSAD